MKKIVSLITLLLLLANITFSQTDNSKGKYIITNYTTKDYNAETQNWCITQDMRGVIYVGNNDCLLEYDGVNWRKIYNSNNSIVRSLDIDANGIIYIGASSEFGFLKPNDFGKLEYISISSHLDSTVNILSDVWQTVCTENSIIFRGGEGIVKIPYFDVKKDSIEIDTSLIKIFTTSSKFYSIFNIQNKLYVIEKSKGLCLLENDSIILAPNGDFFKTKIPFSILPFSSDTVICGIYRGSILKYNTLTGEVFEIESDASQILTDNRIYKGTTTYNNNFAFATLGTGVVMVDNSGKLNNIISENNGLKDNVVGYIYNQPNTGLWLATNTAISKAEIETPFVFWDSENQIASTIEDCFVFNNKVYISNLSGIQYLKNDTFFLLEDVFNSQVYNFLQIENSKDTFFIYGGGTGLFQYTKKGNEKIIDGINFRSCIESKIYKNLIYSGYEKGFILFSENLKYGKSHDYTNYKSYNFTEIFDFEADFMTEDSLANLWIFSEYNGVYCISATNKINPDLLNFHKDSVTITKYTEAEGLPSIIEAKLYFIDNKLLYSSYNGIYEFDYKNNIFAPFTDFGEKYSEKAMKIHFFEKDFFGNYWIGYQKNQISNIDIVKKQKDGTYLIDSTSLRRIPQMKLTEIFFNKTDSSVYVSGSEGLLKIDINKLKINTEIPDVLIRKVSLNTDSVIFWGYFSENYLNQDIDYEFNNLKFEFALPYFADETQNQYSFYLEGFENEFSEWTNNFEKEYTNLREGDYIFKVKARNIYLTESKITEFKIHINPPWYRTFLAIILYIILSILLILVIVKLYTKRLVNQKIELEKIVKERTIELSEKNSSLEQQKEEIMAQSEELLTQSEELAKINTELEKLSIVASETDSAVIIMDKNGNFEWINDGFTRLYGYNFEELLTILGKNIFETSSNSDIKLILDKCRDEKISVIYESQSKSKNGEIIFVQTTLTPILNQYKKIEKFIAIDSDIRKLKSFENEIIKQKDELKYKNEQINASIRYAKTIQTAILPFKEQIDKQFENFIIFRPKDIVSGDFYWYNEIELKNNNKGLKNNNSYTFIAIIDCTGHGVPGAFMSMIANTLLNEIVNSKRIFETNEILENLDNLIRISLRQEQSDNNDGMDVCFCRIDKFEDSVGLNFSGAKLNLFYFNSQKNEIEIIKGDRRSIGGAHSKKIKEPFKNQNIDIYKNDIIYLSSDGFGDQNNSERKRFGSHQIISLLNNNSQKSLIEQGIAAENSLIKWMSGEEQRDDITFIGLKI